MFQLSIIVPAVGPQEALDNTLLTVLENRPPACEVIVPHSPTYEDPYDLADEVQFVRSAKEDIAALVNSAVERSAADIVHVLHSGTLARAGWTDAALAQFRAEPHVAAIAPAILDLDNDQQLAAAGIRYGRGGVKRLVARGKHPGKLTAKLPWIDGPLLQAAFIRRDVFMRLGGLRNEFGTYHIDTDLAARLRAADAKCVHQPACQVAGPIAESPRGFQAARHAELLYWCHVRHLPRLGRLSCHGLHVAGDLLRQLPRPSTLTAALGRVCGLPQGLLGFGPSEDASPMEDEETISIPIEEGRSRVSQHAQPEPHRARYSRSA